LATGGELVNEILRRQSQLEGQRANWDSLWQRVAEKVIPRQNIFNITGPVTQAETRTERLFDSTAQLALERFAAAMEWMLIPRTQQWHKLAPADDLLREDRDVQIYCDQVTRILFEARYSPQSNFASQAHESFMSLGAFGTGNLFIDDALGSHLRYRVVHLSETYFQENHVGIIDHVHRKFMMSWRQIAQRWPASGAEVHNRAQTNPFTETEVVHAVMPRGELAVGRRDYQGMPYSSCYVLITNRLLLEEGGYWTMPYAVSRYVVAPREVYGRSPAITVFPDINMVNEQRKTDLRARQKAADPPILAPDDDTLAPFDLRPGAMNYGGVNAQGQQMIHPFVTGARLDMSMEGLSETRQIINDAFLVTLFQILVQTPEMTATEALLRAQEKGALLAPTMGRQQSELLGPLIARELDILARAGQLPPMPPALAARRGNVRIVYESPLSRLQRADEGVGILRTLESIAPIAQADPSVMQLFDAEETVRTLAEINGVPAKLLRSKEQMDQIRQQQAAQANMQNVIAAAPQAASAAKDMAQAAATAGNIPPPQPGVGQ